MVNIFKIHAWCKLSYLFLAIILQTKKYQFTLSEHSNIQSKYCKNRQIDTQQVGGFHACILNMFTMYYNQYVIILNIIFQFCERI
jgi:hypothetical protein